MGGIEQGAMHAQQERKGGSRIKRGLLWFGEKSTYVTFPISGVIFVAGAVTGAGSLMALGGAGMGVDVVQNRVAKKWRENEERKLIRARESKLAKVKDIFVSRKNPQLKAA